MSCTCPDDRDLTQLSKEIKVDITVKGVSDIEVIHQNMWRKNMMDLHRNKHRYEGLGRGCFR